MAAHQCPSYRQLELLAMCASGMSREEIGRELFISPWTVKRSLDLSRTHLGACNVTQACSIAIARDLIRVELVDGELITCVAERATLALAA